MDAYEVLHDELMHAQVEPGAIFARAFAWCEDYMRRELAQETPAAAREAVRTYRREVKRRCS